MSEIRTALFSPRSVALVGASADDTKHTALPQRFLGLHRYVGEIFPINPNRAEIKGVRAYPSVQAIGRPVDHAFIMVPTELVLDAVADCAAAGVRCATILANGFGEAGEAGRRRQNELVAVARKSGLRIIGPNSLGVINPVEKVTLSANEVLSLPELLPGEYAVLSQSGSLMGALLSRAHARGIGFSKLISVGNEADLGVGELIDLLVDDEQTRVISLVLETIRDAERMAAAAARAYAAGKPIIALCLGRSALGEQLAASHTGALASNGAAIDAFLSDCGIVRVDLLETLLELPPLLLKHRTPKGRRVAVVSTSGGGGGLVIDSLSATSAEIVGPTEEFASRMAAANVPIGRSALIDVTLAGANSAKFSTVLDSLKDSLPCDLVVAVVGSSAQFRPDRAVAPILASTLKDAKPLAVFLTPHADKAFSALRESGVAAFRTPETCADGVRAFLGMRAMRPPTSHSSQAHREAAELIKAAKRDTLDAISASEVFAALGVPQARQSILTEPCETSCDRIGRDVGFPLVAKILSDDIAHKTEVGGVVVGIRSVSELLQASRSMLERVAVAKPDAEIKGVQVQSIETGLAEVLIGYHRDAQIGPLVTVGLGGVLTEIYRDFATRVAPVDQATALEMIEEVKGLAVIRGYRNLPAGDMRALAKAIECVSNLAHVKGRHGVLEAEINPLIVKAEGEGVIAVDAFIRLGAADSAPHNGSSGSKN